MVPRAAFVLAASLCATASSRSVFPQPRLISLSDSHYVVPSIRFDRSLTASSSRWERTVNRYELLFKSRVGSQPVAASLFLRFDIASLSEELEHTTSGRYTVQFSASESVVHVSSDTQYGAQYALESLNQLLQPCPQAVAGAGRGSLCLPAGIHMEDAPSYSWRGLMLDTGRRFFSMNTTYGILDVMAAAKMNVLHLHASDQCRWSVQSNKYPNLTDALTGILGGYYSQSDIASLVSYAGDRGITLVPEFDIPGHSRGIIPLQYMQNGVQFCEPTDPTRTQLYGDPLNQTYNVITSLFSEMAALFPNSVFHIGSDETAALGPCTVSSTFALERAILQFVKHDLNKTPAGWEEVLFDAGAATPDTIVYAWSQYTPVDVIAAGNRAINAEGSHFYLTEAPSAAFPAGWTSFWYDISTGLNATALPMLLGGETSQWTDTYCYTAQCGASNGATPVGASLFPPTKDSLFAQSIGGMMWPRAFIAAASFWNYNASQSSSDPAFVQAVNTLTQSVIARGYYACPVGCMCNQVSACGTPYGPAPGPGSTLTVSACVDPITEAMNWTVTEEGYLQAGESTSLCVQKAGYNVYPLTMGPCTAGTASVWSHAPATSELIDSDGNCLDMRTSDEAVGTYKCGSGDGLYQPNQQWVIDPVSGYIVSLDNGQCLSMAAP